jgi:hypothetical protein
VLAVECAWEEVGVEDEIAEGRLESQIDVNNKNEIIET